MALCGVPWLTNSIDVLPCAVPNAPHGFACRGELSTEVERGYKETAMAAALNPLAKFL